MSVTILSSDLLRLKSYVENGDTVGYYSYLEFLGDPYGRLARGVVEDNTFSGITARNYAEYVHMNITQTSISDERWNKISQELMEEDFTYRSQIFENNPTDSIELDYKSIKEYHNRVFENNNLMWESWTAEIILATSDDPAAAWDNMLNEGYIPFDNYLIFLEELAKTIAEEYATHGYGFQGQDIGWMLDNMPATYQSAVLLSPAMMTNIITDWGVNNTTEYLDGLTKFIKETSNKFEHYISEVIDVGVLYATKFFTDIVKYWITDNAIMQHGMNGAWQLGEIVQETDFTRFIDNIFYVNERCYEIVGRLDETAYIYLEKNEKGEYHYVGSTFDPSGQNDIADGVTELGTLKFFEFDAIVKIANNYYMVAYDPLVIDLDGDGLETIAHNDSLAQFDLFTEKGLMAKHGWVSPDDALLAIDLNGDGKINDISELFGSRNTPGFAELARLDSNNDGEIDSSDDKFSSILVWIDKNGDGLSQVEEMSGLIDHGINSISLSSTKILENNNGNIVSEISYFTKSDGSIGLIGDVSFLVDLSTLSTNRVADTFFFEAGTGYHKLATFEDGLDLIAISGGSFESLEFETHVNETATSVYMDGLEIKVSNITAENLTRDDFIFI